MRRFRRWRRRSAALALLPVAATIAALGTQPATGAPGGEQETGTFDSSRSRVGVNESVTLSGRFATPRTAAAPAGENAPGADPSVQGVRIQFRALGAESWQVAGRTVTGRSGRFSERVDVSRSGRFRALSADGRTTPADLVRLKSKTRALVANETVKLGDRITVRGSVAPAGTRRRVTVRLGGETEKARTRKNGRFAVELRADEVGESTVRVHAAANKVAAGSGDRAGRVVVLRPAIASYYGPGLYGNALGCGGTLQPDTVGVAHKTLPCGTKLIVAYGNESVRTEVIDRGPYSGNREFDLTEALKNKLGFGSTGTVYVSK